MKAIHKAAREIVLAFSKNLEGPKLKISKRNTDLRLKNKFIHDHYTEEFWVNIYMGHENSNRTWEHDKTDLRGKTCLVLTQIST